MGWITQRWKERERKRQRSCMPWWTSLVAMTTQPGEQETGTYRICFCWDLHMWHSAAFAPRKNEGEVCVCVCAGLYETYMPAVSKQTVFSCLSRNIEDKNEANRQEVSCSLWSFLTQWGRSWATILAKDKTWNFEAGRWKIFLLWCLFLPFFLLCASLPLPFCLAFLFALALSFYRLSLTSPPPLSSRE